GGPAADAAHVVAGARAGGGEAGGLLVEEAYGAAEGVDRVRGAERAPGVAAGALEGHAVAAGPERLVGDGIVLAAVDGDERVDAGPAPAEQVFHPAQVAEPLLADGADEEEIGPGAEVRGVHGAEDGEQDHEAAGVVADAGGEEGVPALADGHVRALGEDGVEVSGEGHGAVAGGAAPEGDHVPLLIDVDGVRAGLPEHLRVLAGADLLLEGRRR